MRALAAAAALLCSAAAAQTVSMSGRLGDKALLMIDGSPRTVATGNTVQGVKLLSVASDSSVVEVGGKRVTLPLGGSQVNLGGAASEGGGSKIVLTAGSGGHFVTAGSINGRAVQFVVDTGATNVSLSQVEADRIGLKYKDGEHGLANTANGQVPVHRVMLGSVRVGDVQVYNVEALVVPAQMPFVLLGNSFLTRFQMKRENDVMTLEKRP
ncbi:MAG TPA: retropepsin-like aspartic protease [Rhizobacter sp.]|nr:retropepsin-like aspartic protease [Rhizobacter sp.]